MLCFLIFLLGVILRVYDLGGESIDLEEYACLSAIDAPDYGTFFEQQRELYPYGAPLAPTLIYYWTRIAGDSIATIRFLFAMAGIIVMILGYIVARLLFDSRRAALVMLLCISLSPVHVFHSQEARMYALVSLFTLCSA
ncbi:MAG: glycosyltransferase family 39 protein, partial [Candidatus Hydrogenedentes bacterium]|nr:glycosyltransferase family 39 protein [Candidatus Hydrogenedentota bacterium]